METPDLGFGDPTALGAVDEWPIGRLFAAAAKLSGPVMWRLADRHGTSPAGFFLLRALVVQDGRRAGELARQLMITPATVTSVVGTLERNGHVERRPDPADRRAVRVHITGSGLALVTATGSALAEDLWGLYDVDEADEPAVRRFLLTLIARFHAFQDDGGLAACAAGPPDAGTARPADRSPAGRTADPPVTTTAREEST
ncbi:MarR family winged helix-turn-helix transcriptional regulator [Actinomadura sp. 9N407]|uniref:MarR family winged helix-turn-helix transcriptional regulator n=1 Tax=Actinomadura sp. 9N407 TaxID=3375154 RepID=UPI00379D6156